MSCLDFHPFHQILASGSKDFSVRFFEYSKPSVKKAYKSIQVSTNDAIKEETTPMMEILKPSQKNNLWIYKYIVSTTYKFS